MATETIMNNDCAMLRFHGFLLLMLAFRCASFIPRRQRAAVASYPRSLGAISSTQTNNNNWIDVHDALRLSTTSARFVDGTWYHKGDRNGLADFLSGPRITGAVHFDLASDVFAQAPSQQQQLHPQPTVEQFESTMTTLGIENDDTIVLYASSPLCYFLPRVWFTFRHVMGHSNTFLLRGTLDDWMEAGGPTDVSSKSKDSDLSDRKSAKPYKVNSYNPSVLIGLEDMKKKVSSGVPVAGSTSTVILDARGSSFAKVGHMPGAYHVPYESLHDNQTKKNRFRQSEELRHQLKDLVDFNNDDGDVVLTCGSGVSACSLYLALSDAGYKGRVRVYDGSWYEWGSQPDTPKVLPSAVS